MIRHPGGLRQIGLVVRDAMAAMQHWASAMGVGPFYVYDRISFGDYRYRGRPAVSPVVTLGFAQAGDLQVEIIQQHDDAASGYRDFLARGREGCQHVSSWVDSPAAYDAAHAAARKAGAILVHEGNTGQARFAYFEPAAALPYGLEFEIAEGLLPELAPVQALLRNAARDWDGSDPIRFVPPAGND